MNNEKNPETEARKQKKREERSVAELQAKASFKTSPVSMKLWAKGLPADTLFMVVVFALLSIGLVMVFSASFVWGFYQNGGDSYFYIKKQLGFAAVGVAVMLLTSRINYNFLRFFAYIVYAASIVLLVVALVAGNGDVNRWIVVFGITIQPSEIAKLGTIMCLSLYMAVNYNKMKSFLHGFVIPLAIIGVPTLLTVIEPHLSGAILIAGVGLVLIFVGGTSLKFLLPAGGVAVVGGATAVMLLGNYMADRIKIWLDPFADPLGAGFQTIQGLYAIGSGGLFGLGLGKSRQKYLYIPEPQNDFIFAIVCEELGFVGAMIIIALFVILIYRGYKIAMNAPDKFGFFLVVGIITRVALQAALNIAVVTNTIPNTGISLPFFSYGGTSLLILLFEMGIVLSVSRYSRLNKN